MPRAPGPRASNLPCRGFSAWRSPRLRQSPCSSAPQGHVVNPKPRIVKPMLLAGHFKGSGDYASRVSRLGFRIKGVGLRRYRPTSLPTTIVRMCYRTAYGCNACNKYSILPKPLLRHFFVRKVQLERPKKHMPF